MSRSTGPRSRNIWKRTSPSVRIARMTFEDAYETFFALSSKHHFDPRIPEGTEEMLRKLIATFQGDPSTFTAWLDEKLGEAYQYVSEPPAWLQAAEWPIRNGSPMLFVGQLELPRSLLPFAQSDRAFYLFLDSPTGDTCVVTQWD